MPDSRPDQDVPLEGVSVADCSVSLAGAFCSQLLTGLGATVTAVRDTSDAPELRSPFLDRHLRTSDLYQPYLDRGKRVLTLDLSSEGGRSELRALVSHADVLVEDSSSTLIDQFELPASALIVASVTPHGRTGLRRDVPASDLTIYHGGGPGHATPGLVADPARMPPIRLGSHQGEFASGLAAAIDVCAAILMRASRPDQRIDVDVSCHEAMVNVFRQSVGTFAFLGGGLSRDLARGRGAGGTADNRNIRCKDGWFNVAWAAVQQWDSLKEILGHPAWMEEERLATPALRYKNWALVVPGIEEWTTQHEREVLFNIFQGYRIPCAPVNEGSDLLTSEALTSRDFFVADEDGRVMPGRIACRRSSAAGERATTGPVRRAEPSGDLPLAGVRVLDFTHFVSGPHATLWLASLGAEVWKVESPKRPDAFRLSLLKPGMQATLNNSPVFAVTNLMKRALTIDISTPDGQALCRRLAQESDVVVSNFRPGVLEQFHLGYDDLSGANPAIVMAAITGYGYEGELAAFQALGPTIHAFSGLSAATGYPDGPPEQFFGTYGDVITGQVAALSILAALHRRAETGRGVFIDTAMTEAILAVAPESILRASATGQRTARRGNDEEGYAPHGCYPCAGNDRWIAIATFDDEQWQALLSVVPLDIAADDARFRTRRSRFESRRELDAMLAEATRAWDAGELAHRLNAVRVAAAPVRTAEDVLADEELLADGFVATLDQPELGTALMPKLPWRIAVGKELARPIGPAPLAAEGTREVLQHVIGLTDEAWDDLVRREIVR